MASKRSEHSKLLDNIGRRIRHLKEDLKNPSNDALRDAGIERNIKALEKFKKQLKDAAEKNPDKKLTNEQIYEATDRMKTDDNLRTDKKKMDEITIKKVFSGEYDETEVKQMLENPVLNELLAKYSRLVGVYIGQSAKPIDDANANDLVERAQAEEKNSELTDNERKILNQIINKITETQGKRHLDGILSGMGE